VTSPDGLLSISFTERINRLNAGLVRDGIPVSDIRRSPALELQFAGAGELARPRDRAQQTGIEPIEGPIEARRVPVISPRESRLRYFLDGAQRTFAVWRCGLVPTAATVATAGILQREPGEDGSVVPGTLRMEHCWLIPSGTGDARVDELLDRIRAEGMRVEDPREFLGAGSDDAEDGSAAEADIDYGRLHELAYRAARRVRDDIEAQVLADWVNQPAWQASDDWIVVDGRLRSQAPRTIGLVKQFTNALLVGSDAETLLGLEPGYRTTAFHPTDRFRGGPDPEARTLWYIRLWDSAGMDARHALVRIEAPHSVRTTDEIDRISSWVLAERTPRATGDARWATLLYPVHLLERILKRRLDADTRGWPGA
jgi:hypothetical protein